MAHDGGHDGPRGSNGSTEALREEIRQTRAELGETVQALAAKADVKSRMKESAAQTADRMKAQAAQAADKLKAQTAQAAGKVKSQTSHAAGRMKSQTTQATGQAKVSASGAKDLAQRSPVPWFTIAGAAALLALVVALRGRRR